MIYSRIFGSRSADSQRGNFPQILRFKILQKLVAASPLPAALGRSKNWTPACPRPQRTGTRLCILGNEPGRRTRMSKEGDIMKRTVCAFAVATLICAATYETSHAAPIAPLTGIRAWSDNITLVYSHHYRHSLPVIIVPPTRRYGYQPYWWPQGQYHWSPYGLERWGYWCEPAGAHRLSC